MLMGLRAGLLSVFITAVTVVIIWIGLNQGWYSWDLSMAAVRENWITTSVTLLFLSTVCSIAIGFMLREVGLTLSKETSLVAELQTANEKLEKQIAQRKMVEATLQEYNERLEELIDQRSQELESAQKELVQKEKLATLGRLAGAVAHEIRHPLGVINNVVYYLNLQNQQSRKDEQNQDTDYLKIIKAETEVAEQIINAMLEYDREEAPQMRKVPPRKMAENILEELPPPEQIQVEILASPGVPEIRIDPLQFNRALKNVLTNAYQAQPMGGKVIIQIEQDDEKVYFKVIDHGEGIPQDQLAQVFEPLFSTRARGMGLGLAIARKLIHSNNGTICVESVYGQGSTFTISFPIDREFVGDK
jgi:signal transduction histidine kinase